MRSYWPKLGGMAQKTLHFGCVCVCFFFFFFFFFFFLIYILCVVIAFKENSV